MDKSFHEMTTAILAAYGWTEGDLAKRVGVSQPHVNRLKKGRVWRPSFQLGTAITALYRERPGSSDAEASAATEAPDEP